VHATLPASTPSSLPAGVARVDRIVLARTDGAPPLQLEVYVPTTVPPAAGFSVILMLDGDAVSAQLSSRDFSRTGGLSGIHDLSLTHDLNGTRSLAASNPALVVTVGYGLEGDALKAARAFDYTPGATQPDPRAPQLQNGGADGFLNCLTGALRDRLMSTYPINASAWSLYGHSYGGLLVLYALCKQPAQFQRYISASPSIWWRDGAINAELDRRIARGNLASHVLIMAGESEAWHPQAVGADGSAASRKDGWATLPLAQALVRRLQPVNTQITVLETIPGATHATLFEQSIAPAIAFATALFDTDQLRAPTHATTQSSTQSLLHSPLTSEQVHFSS